MAKTPFLRKNVLKCFIKFVTTSLVKNLITRGCVTVKVSGHVINRLTDKIVKNVIKDEIDHNGAYLCDYEYSDHLFHQSFSALKCPKIVKIENRYGAPPPPCLAADDLTKKK